MASTNAREKAYQILRSRIIGLELKPGEALNVNELTEQLGMSRTPVREAIIMLELSNLVIVRPQSGTFVAPINLEYAEIEQFARFTLEKEVIHRACGLMGPMDKIRYEENLHLYEFYKASKVPGRAEHLMELDNDFHRIAFVIDGKEAHFTKMQSTLQHIERLRILSLMAYQDEQIFRDHAEIVGALLKGDAPTAEFWVEKHMNRYKEHIQIVKNTFPELFVRQ